MRRFKGLGNIALTDDYKYVPVGEFPAEIVAVKEVESKKALGMINVIMEFKALASDGEAKEGEVYSHIFPVTGEKAQYGFRDLKAVLVAALDEETLSGIESDTDWEDAAESVVCEDSPLVGEKLKIRAFLKAAGEKSKHAGKEFVRVRFVRLEE